MGEYTLNLSYFNEIEAAKIFQLYESLCGYDITGALQGLEGLRLSSFGKRNLKGFIPKDSKAIYII